MRFFLKEQMDKLHDRDIREELFEFLDENFGKIRIIEEKNMGKSRADLVMITETDIVGLEIKSDADTYVRLASQVKDYDKYFDYNYVVVGSSHAMHIEEHVPQYWGIITVENDTDGNEQKAPLDFYILRQPSPNPKMKWAKKIEILWRPELVLLQEWNAMPKYKAMSKDFVRGKILERMESGKIKEETLKKQMSELLMERDYSAIADIVNAYRVENGQKKRRKRKYKRK